MSFMDMRAALRDLLNRFRSSPSPTSSSRAGAHDSVDQRVDDVSLASVLAGLRANLEHNRKALARDPRRQTVQRVVDNRAFLLGLDELYRTGMKPHERTELLEAARAVASKLDVHPDRDPVEGYYAEDARLQEYFRLVRALQRVSESERERVATIPQFVRLLEVVSSPLYGTAAFNGGLLPQGRDPLSHALLSTTKWSVSELTERAQQFAKERDDCSLAGLACLARDAVAITTLRDSTVLYFQSITLGRPPIVIYSWGVDPEIATRAERFVTAFNTLFGERLPSPTPDNAALFGAAYDERASFVGRCVRIGRRPIGWRFL
jgi:hypothetical protein